MPVGTAALVLLRARRNESPLLHRFALTTAASGGAALRSARWLRRGLHLRDLAGAIALAGWRLSQRHAANSSGMAIIVQSLAVTLLALQLSLGVVR